MGRPSVFNEIYGLFVTVGAMSATISFGGHLFHLIGPIHPLRDAGGTIIEEFPQARYRSAQRLSLHAYGTGPFCRFRILGLPRGAGVYALTIDGALHYIGKCDILAERFGPRGYAVIHPRNCFQRGQPTNCRINNEILCETKAGRRLELWFRGENDETQRTMLEALLIR